MKVIHTVKELQQVVKAEKQAGHTIGFVPTMGFLHEGHLTLAKQAKEDNETVIMSIFVNPLQFGPNEDFEKYPRNLDRDCQLAEQIGVDYLFAPAVKEMYPNPPTVTMKATSRTECLCGAKRPGHFDGVVTVVTKLFHLTQADRAYFGLKDAQQIAVIQGLVDTLDFPIELVAIPTVREADGLAKSSRNVYLTDDERAYASQIYQALALGKKRLIQGETDPQTIVKLVTQHLQEHANGEIDYVELLSFPDLTPIQVIKGKLILAVAVKYAHARLIDNLIIQCE